jgi:CSLREA domain-containing protein
MVIASLLSGVLAWAQPVSASTASGVIVVNSFADAVNTDGTCTLREAIMAANKDRTSGSGAGECAAGSGADTIILPSGTYILTRSDQDNDGDWDAVDDLDIYSSITISPTGPVTITAASGYTERIFHILAGGSLVLSHVTISNGKTGGDGGGIYNAGQLVLKNSAIANNKASGRGGGLYNAGTSR